jgi:polar amino acid transport system substrate-binding protein
MPDGRVEQDARAAFQGCLHRVVAAQTATVLLPRRQEGNPMPFELVEPGILTVGVDASAPGALHSDPSTPGFEGFEVDLMMEVAVRLGLTYGYRGGLWAGLIDELREGKLDAIVTAATITEERKSLVDFSEPYLEYRLSIAVRRGGGIRTLADLEEKRLAVRIATTAEQFVRTRAKAAEIRSYHTNVEAYEALRAGVVDAWVEDWPIAQWFVDRIPELELAETIEATEAHYAIMFRKGNDALRRAVDQVLAQLKADGTYDRLYERWFGRRAWRRSPPVVQAREPGATAWSSPPESSAPG